MVNHRVQSIKDADRIYVLEGGEMKTSGSPSSLLEGENLFSKAIMDVVVDKS